MRVWWQKLIGLFLLFTLAGGTLLTPVAVYAQDPDPDPITDIQEPFAPKPWDVVDAIASPTPNLANTTAYVFYTILVLVTGSTSPQALTQEHDAMLERQRTSNNTTNQNKLTTQGEDQLKSNGLIGITGFFISELVRNQPASSGTYVAYLVDQSPLTPQPAYAQGLGVGFNSLQPILRTWAAFRDIAYFLLTFMFLITGLLIISRRKLGGSVAVTVQNALPRLVITLILITFSYAIAGLVVDMMFWAIYFVIYVFSGLFKNGETGGNIFGKTESLNHIALNQNIFTSLFDFVVSGGASGAADAIANLLFDALDQVPIIGTITSFLDKLTFGVFDSVIRMIFVLIIAIALLVQVFRVFFQLLMSYAGFVINVVLSPFILLGGAVPGQDPFMKWFKNLLAGLAPFVVVIFMLFMSYTLVGDNTVSGVGYSNSPDSSGLQLPLIGAGISTRSFLGILAVGFLMLLPEAVKMTKEFLGASGGPFDKYKEKALANFQKGWEGGEVVPGVKVPGAKGLATGMGSGAGVGAAGGALGAGAYGRNKGREIGDKIGGGNKWVTRAGGLVGGLGGGTLGAYGGAFGGTIIGGGLPVYRKVKDSKVAKGIGKSTKFGAQVRQFMDEARAKDLYDQVNTPENSSAGPTKPNTTNNQGSSQQNSNSVPENYKNPLS